MGSLRDIRTQANRDKKNKEKILRVRQSYANVKLKVPTREEHQRDMKIMREFLSKAMKSVLGE
jgi:hypothetical protein